MFFMAERDINRHKTLWENTKEDDYGLHEFKKYNKDIVKEFLNDFEVGMNVPKNSKGRRGPGALLKLRGICVFLNKHFPKKNFDKLTKKQVHKLFDDMGKGKIVKDSGKPCKDVGEFIKNLKVFWGWMIRKGKVETDITEDLSRGEHRKGKPAWVYLSNKDMRKLIDNARGDYRALILFLYDTGIRPQEAYRIKVSDISKDYKTLTIPEFREDGTKVSKTFGRTIKLMQSSQLIKSYVELNNLSREDYLFIPTQAAFNKYMRELSKKLFGSVITGARGSTDALRLYDIRHNSAIYWLDRYKTNKDMMYRFGWKQENKIFYYSEFLGRGDKIDDEDMMRI